MTGAGDCLVAGPQHLAHNTTKLNHCLVLPYFYTCPSVPGTVFALLRSSHLADKWAEARQKKDDQMASDVLAMAVTQGGLVCARHAVMNPEALPHILPPIPRPPQPHPA